MFRPRVIPVLLLGEEGVVKTTRFDAPRYVGDPINAVRIFNEKEVDELILLDILATREGREPRFDLVARIAGECFMPLCYGGGVRTLDQIARLVALGVEKVAVNAATIETPELIPEAARRFGSSTIVASIDVKSRRWRSATVAIHGGRKDTGRDPIAHAISVAAAGAGEILLTSIDRDGTGTGYDLDLIQRVSHVISVPLTACGGAGSIVHLGHALKAGASAAAAGSLFVFHGRHRAVLINYPAPAEIAAMLATA